VVLLNEQSETLEVTGCWAVPPRPGHRSGPRAGTPAESNQLTDPRRLRLVYRW